MRFLIILFISLLSASVPMFFYTATIWWLDRYEREPVYLVAIAFVVGAVPVCIIVLLLDFIFNKVMSLLFQASTVSVVSILISGPIIEEIMKGIPLLILKSNENFDNGTDGIVYGSAIGFGFGMTENFFYFLNSADSSGNFVLLIIVRTLFSALVHAFSTGLVGYFIGRTKFKFKSKPFLIFFGFGLAVFFHISWNSIVYFSDAIQKPFFFIFIITVFPLIFAGMFFLLQLSLKEEAGIIRHELKEEAELGYLPEKFINIVSSYKKRSARGWIDESIRKRFIKVTTELAFKKHELKCAHSYGKTQLQIEIIKLREEVRNLFAYNFE